MKKSGSGSSLIEARQRQIQRKLSGEDLASLSSPNSARHSRSKSITSTANSSANATFRRTLSKGSSLNLKPIPNRNSLRANSSTSLQAMLQRSNSVGENNRHAQKNATFSSAPAVRRSQTTSNIFLPNDNQQPNNDRATRRTSRRQRSSKTTVSPIPNRNSLRGNSASSLQGLLTAHSTTNATATPGKNATFRRSNTTGGNHTAGLARKFGGQNPVQLQTKKMVASHSMSTQDAQDTVQRGTVSGLRGELHRRLSGNDLQQMVKNDMKRSSSLSAQRSKSMMGVAAFTNQGSRGRNSSNANATFTANKQRSKSLTQAGIRSLAQMPPPVSVGKPSPGIQRVNSLTQSLRRFSSNRSLSSHQSLSSHKGCVNNNDDNDDLDWSLQSNDTATIQKGLVVDRRQKMVQMLNLPEIVRPLPLARDFSVGSLGSSVGMLSDSEDEDEDNETKHAAAKTIQEILRVWLAYRQDQKQLQQDLADIQRRRQEELDDVARFLELEKQQFKLELQQENCGDCHSHNLASPEEQEQTCRVHRQWIKENRQAVLAEKKEKGRLLVQVHLQNQRKQKLRLDKLSIQSKTQHLQARLDKVETHIQPWKQLHGKFEAAVAKAEAKLEKAKYRGDSCKKQCRAISRCIRKIMALTKDRLVESNNQDIFVAVEQLQGNGNAAVDQLVGEQWLHQELQSVEARAMEQTKKKGVDGNDTDTTCSSHTTTTTNATAGNPIGKEEMQRPRSRSKSLRRGGSAPDVLSGDDDNDKEKDLTKQIDIDKEEWQKIKNGIKKRRSRSKSLKRGGSAPDLLSMDEEGEGEEKDLTKKIDIEKEEWQKIKKGLVQKKRRSRSKSLKLRGSAPDLLQSLEDDSDDDGGNAKKQPEIKKKMGVRRVQSTSSARAMAAGNYLGDDSSGRSNPVATTKKKVTKKVVRRVKSASTTKSLLD